MLYKVVVVTENDEERVIYEGPKEEVAKDAFAVAAGYARKYYTAEINWELTKYMV